MSINVYKMPPVPVTGSEWTEFAPVQKSRSLISGATLKSAAQRKRRMASLQIAALGRGGNMGAGYVEMLKRLLEGVHAVRLYSLPINWHLDALRDRQRLGGPLSWTIGGAELTWTMPPGALVWFMQAPFEGTISTLGGWNIITVTGLPPSTLVARPGDFITVKETLSDTTGSTVQVLTQAYSDADGIAVLRLFSAPAYSGYVTLGASDTGVFEPVGDYPRRMQPVGQNWYYDWTFSEVFSDEVGGFVEVDPWTPLTAADLP